MNEEKKEQIWLEIQRTIRETSGQKREGEKTIRELAEMWGLRDERTRNIVEALVEARIFIARRGDNRTIFLSPNPEIKDFEGAIRRQLLPQND
jgi:hypothetical protein